MNMYFKQFALIFCPCDFFIDTRSLKFKAILVLFMTDNILKLQTPGGHSFRCGCASSFWNSNPINPALLQSSSLLLAVLTSHTIMEMWFNESRLIPLQLHWVSLCLANSPWSVSGFVFHFASLISTNLNTKNISEMIALISCNATNRLKFNVQLIWSKLHLHNNWYVRDQLAWFDIHLLINMFLLKYFTLSPCMGE